MSTPKPSPAAHAIRNLRAGDTLDKHYITKVEHCTTDYANVHIHAESGDGGTRMWCFNRETPVERIGSGQYVTVRAA